VKNLGSRLEPSVGSHTKVLAFSGFVRVFAFFSHFSMDLSKTIKIAFERLKTIPIKILLFRTEGFLRFQFKSWVAAVRNLNIYLAHR
jgi:hypothetical protein